MADRNADLRILVPLDGSDLATVSLPFVRALATEASEVVLLRVVQDSEPLLGITAAASDRVERILSRNEETAKHYLEGVAAILTNETRQLHIRTEVGIPHIVIARVATEEQVDLIVMATRGRGFLGRAVVGSVADRVTRTAPVPVLMIHPHEHEVPARAQEVGNMRRVIVPLDGSDLARQALPVAERIARVLDIPIHLLRAMDLRGEWVIGDEEEEWLLEPMREDLAEILHSEAKRLQGEGIPATFELTVGAVTKVIRDAVEPGDFVVMTSHGAGGLRRWLLGSVAEKLIHSGVAPVMLVPVVGREEMAAPYAKA
jgi:nucleotide-binding universal stress UspA family protein